MYRLTRRKHLAPIKCCFSNLTKKIRHYNYLKKKKKENIVKENCSMRQCLPVSIKNNFLCAKDKKIFIRLIDCSMHSKYRNNYFGVKFFGEKNL